MCGSPDPPPPPPDYSQQKANFQRQQQQQYDRQASEYNAVASAFNQNIADFGQRVGTGSAQFGNLTIADADRIDDAYNFWSDLRTQASSPWDFTYGGTNSSSGGGIQPSPNAPPIMSAPGGGFDGGTFNAGDYDLSGLNNNRDAYQPLWNQQRSGLYGVGGQAQPNAPTLAQPTNAPPANTATNPSRTFSFNGLTGFNLQAPNFTSVVATPYDNQTVGLNIPNLVQPDLSSASNYVQQVENALSSLEALRRARTEEQNRVSGFQTNYTGQLGDLVSRLDNVSFADAAAINSVESELARLENQRRGFTTALSNEYSDFLGYNSPAAEYQQIRDAIAGLEGQRASEQDRVSQFRNDQLSLFDTARNELSGYGIGDIDAIRALDQRIDNAARDTRRFQSELNPDLTIQRDAYNEVNSMVDRLLNERAGEERRISGYEAQLLQRARSLENQASRLGVADAQQASALMSEADALRREAQGFSSQIGFDFSDELAPLDALQNRIGQLEQSRAAEEGRIGGFRSDLSNRLADIRQRASQLDISDLDAIRALDDELEALDRESRNFEAEIPFDFSALYNDYTGVDRQLADLYNQRSTEEQRVRSATQTAADRASDLLRSATLSDYYDASRLDALGLDLERARSSATGFSSALDADFSPALDALSQAEARLAELRGQRQESIGEFSGRADEIRSSLEGLADYDESGMRQQRSLAQQVLNELALFRGEDASTARSAFSDILNLADERTTALNSTRTDMETRARQLRTELRDRAFNTPEELEAKREELRALEDEVNQFRATQAEDEISDIFRLLDGEGARFAQDANTRDAVARREREDAQRMFAESNINRFFEQLRYTPTTRTDYNEMLRLMNSRNQSPSAFARSVMQAG